MKTSKDKAEELVENFSKAQDEDGYINTNKHRHIECAKIAVDEIIKALPVYDLNPKLEYWQEVKNELKKML